MMEALIVSNIALWIITLASLLGVLAMARQIGVLYERIAPMGALMMDTGPKVGDPAPRFTLESLTGGQVAIGGAAAHSTLLFFVSPSCPVCKKLLPIVKSIRATEQPWLRVVLASDGERAEHEAFCERAALQDFPYVLSADLGMSFHIAKLPYAVLLDERGNIRAKGLVNSREQLESLFTAHELGVPSVQAFLDQPA
jgi:methylamine dehydrogenase accessory protein MauD